MNFGNVIFALFNFAGSLCLLLFGMKLMSDGIQKSAGARIQGVLGFMTKNRFLGLLTGCILTMVIQSSGVTTVMVVSFVNAALMTLEQSVAVIFGANIGTTVTAWIVSLFGFDFKVSAFAIPIFALGYILSVIRRHRYANMGLAVMGFSLLFIALGWLSESISLNSENMSFLTKIQALGFWSYPIAVCIGIIATALIHSSSAMTAIIIAMAYNGLLTWNFSAALVIGSNIGSTVDSIMASFGAKTNARRASLVHVLFNCTTALLALIFLPYLTRLVDFITPGKAESAIVYHIAMLHTLFNLFGTLIFLPFTKQLASLTEKLIADKKEEIPEHYSFPFNEYAVRESAVIPLMQLHTEIKTMADYTVEMFDSIQRGFSDKKAFLSGEYEKIEKREAYLDEMKEQLTAFLVRCHSLEVTEELFSQMQTLISIVEELENLSDECLSLAVYIKRAEEKNLSVPKEDKERLLPYIELVRQLLYFVYRHIGDELTTSQHDFANSLEEMIDSERTELKRLARHRLEQGKNVKAELLYIDIVRKIEKMGDNCFSIAGIITRR